jgi:hypothetical protein
VVSSCERFIVMVMSPHSLRHRPYQNAATLAALAKSGGLLAFAARIRVWRRGGRRVARRSATNDRRLGICFFSAVEGADSGA